MSKPYETMSVEELDVCIRDLNNAHDAVCAEHKRKVLDLQRLLTEKTAEREATKKLAAMSSAELEQLKKKLLGPQSVPSGEALGTPGK